jgi:hypothetical protein
MARQKVTEEEKRFWAIAIEHFNIEFGGIERLVSKVFRRIFSARTNCL